MASEPKKALEIFFSYSHRDQDLRDQLETHLSLLKNQGLVSSWHDRKIVAGTEWAREIDTHLNTAQIILLLISADFLASTYCYGIEVKRAMERHHVREARVIPIILRYCEWHSALFGNSKRFQRMVNLLIAEIGTIETKHSIILLRVSENSLKTVKHHNLLQV